MIVYTYIHTFMYNCTYAKMASNYVTATVTIYIFLLQVRKSSRSCWMYGVSHPPLPPTAMINGIYHLQVWLCMYLSIYLKISAMSYHYFVAESWESCNCTGKGFPPPEAGRPDLAIGYCGGLLPHHVPALCPDMQGRAYAQYLRKSCTSMYCMLYVCR